MNTTASGVNATPSDEGTRTTGSEAGERDPFSAMTLLRPTRNTPTPLGGTLSSPHPPVPPGMQTFPFTGLVILGGPSLASARLTVHDEMEGA